MRLTFYGRLRDGLSPSDVPDELADVDALRAWLAGRMPEAVDPTVRIAVNDELIAGNRPLASDDEVAFLPPVSGG